jgi:carbonic anhydrase
VRALLEGPPPGTEDFVAPCKGKARGARDRVLLRCEAVSDEERQEAGEREVVRLSLENLMTFPWIREAVDEGRLRLHGGHFGVLSGRLYMLGESGEFAPVGEAAAT